MKRREATARYCLENPQADFNLGFTHFANINEGKDVWWYDIPLHKVIENRRGFLLLLAYDNLSLELHALNVPIQFMRDNLKKMFVRLDKQTISLELSSLKPTLFQDIRPGSSRISFGKFKR